MTTDPTDTPTPAMRAAEYVLHLMPSADRKDFETAIAWDASVRAEVAFWSEHFAPIADDVAPVAPPADMKSRIEGVLFDDIGHNARLSSRIRLWRSAAFGFAAVAAAAAFLAFSPVLAPPDGPGTGPSGAGILTADVAAQDASLRLIAIYQPETGELKLNRTAGTAPSQRVLELWAIIGDEAPVSLGVLPDTAQTAIAVPEALRATFETATLAITDEPVGGAPGGQATGSVLAIGPLVSF